MKITEQFKTQYLDYLRRYLPQEITQNTDFLNAVFTGLDELKEISAPEVCAARKNGLAISCESTDLAERMLKLANGNEFIAGARFKNLDINFPFIEITPATEMSPEILCEISRIVQDQFKNLRPKGLKFKSKPTAHSNFEQWSHTVFGRIEKKEISQIPTGLDLSFTQNLDWHQRYATEYYERIAEKQELNGFVRVGQLDEFQESAKDQALLVASDADGFCGVIAGTNNPLYGLSAIYMIESYLSKRWVGKKLAPIAHDFFLNELAKKYDYVWGTIYAKNLSSLKTALRVGRRIIETEYFVRFDD